MIILENVSKRYGTGMTGLENISFTIDKGEFVFLTGQSGSGKTTLLRLMIRDTLPSEGSVVVNDWDLTKLPQSKIPHLRRKIGVVFQDLKMLMDRTIRENILLPLEVTGVDRKVAEGKVDEILTQVGILDHKDKFPIQLSGGELQRAAIARALVFSPDILLADEPTGNLDTATSWEIVKILQDINKSGTTVVMATHNTDIVDSLLKRVIALEKGKMIKDHKPKGASGAASKDEKAGTASEEKKAEHDHNDKDNKEEKAEASAAHEKKEHKTEHAEKAHEDKKEESK